MSSDIATHTAEYRQWLGELKTRFRQVQLKAAVTANTANTAMLQFYWELGADLVEKQKAYAWGQDFVGQLSADLMREFPDVKGFSVRNLKNARQWYTFWLPMPIGQQAVAQFLSIPWGHNLATYTLPETLRGKLPSIEAIERELGLDVGGDGDLGEADGGGV